MPDSDQSPHLSEEPQSERGARGSRDAGGPPGAGPADRPAGDPHGETSGSGGAPGSFEPAHGSGGTEGTGSPVPPYEGRKETAEPHQEGGSYRDGARVGGATGPVDDDGPEVVDPAQTPGGRTTTPGDEQPAAQMPDGESQEQGVDLTAHVPGVPKGERSGG